VAEGQRPTVLYCSGNAEELILLTLAVEVRQYCSSLIWTAPDYRPAAWLRRIAISTSQLKKTAPDMSLHGELSVEQDA